MSAILYYSADRDEPLGSAERAALEGLLAGHPELVLEEEPEPPRIVDGATELPDEPRDYLPVVDAVLRGVTELRSALPGAAWEVTIEDQPIEWSDLDGYTTPEWLRNAE